MKKGKKSNVKKGSMADQLQDVAPQSEELETQTSEAESSESEVQSDNPPDVDVTSTDTTDTTDTQDADTVQATLSEPEPPVDPVDEFADKEIHNVSLPKEKCFVCRHLLVGMPDALPAGDKMKKVRSAEFSCYTEPGCPAHYVRVIYDPFTRTMIENAILSYWTDGDRGPWNDLDRQADNTSVEVRDKYHRTVKEVMANFARQ